MDIIGFALCIHTLCTRHNGSVTSWVRSPAHNARIGGAERSLHLYGLAVDIVFDDDPGKHAAMIYARRAGLSMLDEGDHVHFQAWAPSTAGA